MKSLSDLSIRYVTLPSLLGLALVVSASAYTAADSRLVPHGPRAGSGNVSVAVLHGPGPDDDSVGQVAVLHGPGPDDDSVGQVAVLHGPGPDDDSVGDVA